MTAHLVSDPEQLLTLCIPAFLALCGTLALLAPNQFRALARRGGKWVDSSRFFAVLDKRIDVDQFFLARTRTFGVVLLAGAVVIALLGKV